MIAYDTPHPPRPRHDGSGLRDMRMKPTYITYLDILLPFGFRSSFFLLVLGFFGFPSNCSLTSRGPLHLGASFALQFGHYSPD